jgi:hypothetical protein
MIINLFIDLLPSLIIVDEQKTVTKVKPYESNNFATNFLFCFLFLVSLSLLCIPEIPSPPMRQLIFVLKSQVIFSSPHYEDNGDNIERDMAASKENIQGHYRNSNI